MESQYAYSSTAGLASYDEGLRKYMLQVYNYMTLALAISGMVSLGISLSPELMAAIWGTPLKWVAMFAPLAMSFLFMGMIDKMSSSSARTFLFVFAAVMGLSLSSIFAVFKLGSITSVFFITAATFGAASLYGYTTKANLTKFGSFLIMGAIGLVIASLVNVFLQSSAFAFAISAIGVLVFTALTAYDTQQIKYHYDASFDEEREKIGVIGAFQLYMDFINIFISLLQLIGERKD